MDFSCQNLLMINGFLWISCQDTQSHVLLLSNMPAVQQHCLYYWRHVASNYERIIFLWMEKHGGVGQDAFRLTLRYNSTVFEWTGESYKNIMNNVFPRIRCAISQTYMTSNVAQLTYYFRYRQLQMISANPIETVLRQIYWFSLHYKQ